MAQVIKSMSDLNKQINAACNKAVENAANKLLEKLQEYIKEDYYNLYAPKYYIPRTMKFYESAVANIIGNSTATIGIDELYMSYQYPARYKYLDGTSGHWTGEDQVYMADAGFHGNVNIYRDGHFWKDFIRFCEENALNILKQELKKQGLNVR